MRFSLQRHQAQPLSRLLCPAGLLLAVCLSMPAVTGAGAALSPHVYKSLTRSQQQLEQGNDQAALQALDALLEAGGLSSYEEAVVQQLLGHAYLDREDYPAAIGAFERSLALQQLPPATAQQLRYNLGQLYLTTGRTGEAISTLETWFDAETAPAAHAHVLLAQAYAQQQRYRDAIPQLQQANRLSATPHAEWYEALLGMHYELQSYRACVPLLKQMLRLFPDRAGYWQQLAGVHMALNNREAALAALELAQRQGALQSEQQRLQLAQLYLSAGVPYKAARLLQEQLASGMIRDTARNRELLAEAWTSAREREQAIRALEQAIEKDAAPGLRLQLAQWYGESGDWQAATRVLGPLENGTGSGDNAQASLLLGIAHFELGDVDAARTAFESARNAAKTRVSARQWLEFIATLPAGTS